MRLHMPALEVHLAQLMRCKREGGITGIQLAIGPRFMQETATEAEGFFEELQGCSDVRDVDDGVGKFHGSAVLAGERAH